MPSAMHGHSYEKRVVARRLRDDMTPAESKLWTYLRANRLGVHFRRQQVIEGFIVDFYCRPLGLVVEVDGAVHETQADYDHERDQILSYAGLTIVRITNDQVMRSIDEALLKIDGAIKSLTLRQEDKADCQGERALPSGGDGVGPNAVNHAPERMLPPSGRSAGLGSGAGLYPVNLRIARKRCVVVGGGKVAARKVKGLLDGDAQVLVIAPEVTGEIASIVSDGRITWAQCEYDKQDLIGAFLVIAATNDRGVNAAVAADADALGILVNSADSPADGTFITPSVVRRGDLLLTVSTSGGSPTLTAVVREQLEAEYGEEWAALTGLLGSVREEIKSLNGTEADRKSAVRRLVQDSHLRAMLKEGRRNEAEAYALQCLLSWSE